MSISLQQTAQIMREMCVYDKSIRSLDIWHDEGMMTHNITITHSCGYVYRTTCNYTVDMKEKLSNYCNPWRQYKESL